MNSRLMTVLSAALCGAIVGLFGAAASSADTPTKPNPPSSICVNGQCATTPVPGTPPVTNASPHSVKWNPGHYMASNAVLFGGVPLATLQPEMNTLNNADSIQGYRVWITWGAFETSQGTYDFSVLDAVLAQLKTAYNKPKRMVIGLWFYGQSALLSNDSRVLPMYIQQNPMYGASPVAGSYGWWGKNSNGTSTGLYAVALYNSAVMDRFIAAVQALGNHYDGDPYVEALTVQENSAVSQAAANLGSVDPNYSDDAWMQQTQRFLTAATAAFPHTSVIMQNAFFVKPGDAVTLEQWMATNRISAGAPDSWGQTSINTYGATDLSDGIKTYLGVEQGGGTTDLRPQMRSMIEVQMPDLVGNYFASKGGPWSPLDIINAANQTYFASHVFWTHLFGSETFNGVHVPPAAKWANLVVTCAANPLTHTDYPANYP